MNKEIQRISKYTGSRTSIFRKTLTDQEGNKSFYNVIYNLNARVLKAINYQEILFVPKFTMSANEFLLKLRVGVVDNGEFFTEFSKIEIQEEIGYFANHVEKLSSFYSTEVFCNQQLHPYLPTDPDYTTKKAEETKKISLIEMRLDEALDNIAKNFIVDAKTICGIYRYKHFLTLS